MASAERNRTAQKYGLSTAMAAALSFLLIVVSGTSTARETRALLAREAMIHHSRQTKDPGHLLEQAYSAALFHQKLPHDEIVRRTIEKRREWKALRRTGLEGEWRTSEKGKTLIRAIGRIATQPIGWGSTGVEGANMVIHYYEDWMRGREVPRATQRLAERYQEIEKDFASPEGAVFESVVGLYKENADFRKTWDQLFLGRYGFRPNASDQTVMEKYPDFAKHEWVRKIWEEVQAGGDEREVLRTMHEMQDKNLKSIDETLQRMDTSYKEMRKQLTDEEQHRIATSVEAIEMAGYRSAVSLAATVIGFGNPKLGNQIRATSDAVFGVRAALKTYETAQTLGANMNLASLALTSNVAGAVLTVVDVFSSGPTADEIILEELGRLRQQVHEIRQEMHKRFDGVHDHLDEIYDTMNRGFDLLIDNDARNARKMDGIKREINHARAQLSDIRGLQLDTQSIIVQQGELLLHTINRHQLAPCTRAYGMGDGDRMSVEKFRDCRAIIETLSEQLPELQLGEDLQTPTALSAWLDARSDRTIAQSFKTFKRLLEATGAEGKERAAGLPESVVGPEAWFYVVETHDQFLAEHQAHAARDAEAIAASDFVRSMRQRRDDLRRYAEAIKDELRAFQQAERETVFSGLFEEAWGPSGRETLTQLIQNGYDSFYEDKDRSGIRTIRQDGAVIPEVSFDGDPYAWRPMKMFYPQGLPEWVSGYECHFRHTGTPRRVVESFRQYLHGDGILRFVHPNDVMLARLGIVDLNACVISSPSYLGPRVANMPLGRFGLFLRLEIWAYKNGAPACSGKISDTRRRNAYPFVARHPERWMAGDAPPELTDGNLRGFRSFIENLKKPDRPSLNDATSNPACQQLYLSHFSEKKEALLRYVWDRLSRSKHFRDMDRNVSIANAHLRSWIALAFHDAVEDSDMMAAVALGWAGFPGLQQLLETSQDAGLSPRDLVGEVTKRFGLLAKAFRSAAMREAATYGYGHRILIGTRFGNLDVIGHWIPITDGWSLSSD